MVIMPKESQIVLEEEYDQDDTMAEGKDRDNEGVWIDGEEELSYDLRYNGEGKINFCTTRWHAEDSFEASNHDTRKFIRKSRNTIYLSTTQAKPIDLSRTSHLQFQALNLRHELDVHCQSGANRRKSAS